MLEIVLPEKVGWWVYSAALQSLEQYVSMFKGSALPTCLWDFFLPFSIACGAFPTSTGIVPVVGWIASFQKDMLES